MPTICNNRKGVKKHSGIFYYTYIHNHDTMPTICNNRKGVKKHSGIFSSKLHQ